jgi:hypothetical protein
VVDVEFFIVLDFEDMMQVTDSLDFCGANLLLITEVSLLHEIIYIIINLIAEAVELTCN